MNECECELPLDLASSIDFRIYTCADPKYKIGYNEMNEDTMEMSAVSLCTGEDEDLNN